MKIPKSHYYFLFKNGYITVRGVEFSDRFVAINSETTRQGNSLINPLEAIRKFGLIPKSMFPQVETFDEYHNRNLLTDDMLKLGKEFLRYFNVNYERVYEKDFSEVLDKELIDVGGFAWPAQINGEYPRTENQPNHAFIIYKKPTYYAFDNYPDSYDGDFVKKLAPDYDLIDYGYRIIISLNTPKKNWLQRLIDFFKGRIKN